MKLAQLEMVLRISEQRDKLLRAIQRGEIRVLVTDPSGPIEHAELNTLVLPAVKVWLSRQLARIDADLRGRGVDPD